MTLEEINIRQNTIDRLYQAILESNVEFPAVIREIFHQQMNALTELKSKQ